MGNFVRTPRGPGVVTGDTHAASLTGSNTMALDNSIASSSVIDGYTSNSLPAMLERDATSEITITPTTSTNIVVLSTFVNVTKTSNSGTFTVRIKEGTTTHFSSTSPTIGINSIWTAVFVATLTNVTPTSHSYRTTIESSTNDGAINRAVLTAKVIQLSGSDTHAAILTGSAGTCQ